MVTTTEHQQMHAPAHPGAVLRELYLEPLKITQAKAAEALGISRKHISEIIRGVQRLTPEMAARLAVAFSTSPDLWINLQAQYDVWLIRQQPPPKVKVLRAAA